MKNAIALLTAGATILVTSLACGGGGATYANVEACTAYAEHMNALECYPSEMDVSQTCPAALDMNPCDMTSYYQCLVENSRCEGELPKFETGACDPTC